MQQRKPLTVANLASHIKENGYTVHFCPIFKVRGETSDYLYRNMNTIVAEKTKTRWEISFIKSSFMYRLI